MSPALGPTFWSAGRLLELAPWGAALVVLLVGAAALGRVLLVRTARPVPARFVRGEDSGLAMLEFVMVFPFFTLVVLLVIQMALLINARVMVGYAAYTAARSAVVWLPRGEEVGVEKAERAAAIGCMPISPDVYRLSHRLLPHLAHLTDSAVGDLLAAVDAAPLTPLFAHTEPSRHLRRAGGKYRYAKWMTEVEIEPAVEGGGRPPHGLVKVTVRHDHYLPVPWAGEVFGRVLGGWTGRFLPFMTIEEHFTLQNEGRVVRRVGS